MIDVEQFHGDGAHIVDGTDVPNAGDVLAVTVTSSL